MVREAQRNRMRVRVYRPLVDLTRGDASAFSYEIVWRHVKIDAREPGRARRGAGNFLLRAKSL